jgi:hypothetical protein
VSPGMPLRSSVSGHGSATPDGLFRRIGDRGESLCFYPTGIRACPVTVMMPVETSVVTGVNTWVTVTTT